MFRLCPEMRRQTRTKEGRLRIERFAFETFSKSSNEHFWEFAFDRGGERREQNARKKTKAFCFSLFALFQHLHMFFCHRKKKERKKEREGMEKGRTKRRKKRKKRKKKEKMGNKHENEVRKQLTKHERAGSLPSLTNFSRLCVKIFGSGPTHTEGQAKRRWDSEVACFDWMCSEKSMIHKLSFRTCLDLVRLFELCRNDTKLF